MKKVNINGQNSIYTKRLEVLLKTLEQTCPACLLVMKMTIWNYIYLIQLIPLMNILQI